jgi:hypothetical protein
MTNQLCPLCDSPATYEISHQPYCKHFTCPVCTEFFIDPSSERHLSGLVEVPKTEFRKKLSAAARASGPEQIFVIRAPRPDEIGGDGHGIARTNLIAEHISRER